ncbi:protein prenyltransferase alpha subunit repeat-containing protein 1-B [Sitodiplosis mosellana]|uniref:protein prenyltransferase alpha subunit repeat-containing protein 1-B n=1 Tax=Sitodiplosis mosellana TaxID=263140 RepID=UPI0024452887|nr:protein prenyltransferase alpha subunit repeat-containing protein 1-B [Sitodiplosis mosellana]
MDYENHDVCEKIINDIDAVFNKDPNLSTFEIINVDESQTKNKTPVVHVDNHLGLESWCCPCVYKHAHQIILAAVKKYPHHLSCQTHEGNGNDQPHHPFNHTLVKYLNCALLINPDVSTFWNARRRLLQKDRLDIGREFKFSAIVLSKKPKSNDAFFYRRWLFSFQSHESIDWTRELSLCERCASKSLSNYQAWAHRQWVLQKAPFLLQYELQTTERFIRKHIGDYSGYFHRQFVLYKMNELIYFEHEPINEGNLAQYTALINYLASIGSTDAEKIRNQLLTANGDYHKPAWKILMKIIIPQRDCDSDNDRIKSFLYCLNVAAYDLKFTSELKEMFGYREAFECHRRAIIRFLAEQCADWAVIPLLLNAVSKS